jgi:Neutral/alkaline non-lysosomal ceramidase.
MRVGASTINITPELPFPLAGSYHMRMSQRVHDPLYANSTVIESKGVTVVFVSCDLIEMDSDSATRIREKAAGEIGIIPENIIISCTHTHQGPKTSAMGLMPYETCIINVSLVKEIEEKIGDGIIKAWKSLKPARMGYGKGSVENCGFNRRYIMSDGRARTNPFPCGPNPKRLMVEGPVDKEVQVTWFEDTEGNYISVIVNFSSHPAVLYNEEVVSSDFPGSMRQVLQTVLGEPVPILYLQGACGNIDTYDFENERTEGLGFEAHKRIGRILGGEVLKILAQGYSLLQEEFDISVDHSILNIPYRRAITEVEYKNAVEVLNSITEEEKITADKFETMDAIYRNLSVVKLYEASKKNTEVQIEINHIRIGDIVFVTNPAELFVEYQLEIKKRFKEYPVMVVENTNGYSGYVPTLHALVLGGYETEFTAGSKLDAKAGCIIMDESIRLIKEGIGRMGRSF